MLHSCTKTSTAFVGPWRIKSGGDDFFLSRNRLHLSCSSRFVFISYIITHDVFDKFLKLCKILADHDQCIQWCKENNLLASSIKCPRENCSNTLTWTRRTSSRDGYEWRCSRGKWHRCAHSALKIHGGESNEVCLVQEHPKSSSKATYRNGCGVSSMDTILLET